MAVATLRSFASGSSLYATDFVAHLVDPKVRTFAQRHIAAPKFETLDIAKADVEKAIERLRMVDDNRAVEDAAQETRTSEWEEQTERAAELQRKPKSATGSSSSAKKRQTRAQRMRRGAYLALDPARFVARVKNLPGDKKRFTERSFLRKCLPRSMPLRLRLARRCASKHGREGRGSRREQGERGLGQD